MRRLGSVLILMSFASVRGSEPTDQTGVVEYIQELTGKVDALERTVSELEKRLNILEQHLHLNASKEMKAKQVKTLPKAGGIPTAERLWDDAMCALQQKAYDRASQLFVAFLSAYPNHTNSAHANYWLGEIQQLNKQYAKAQGYYAAAYKSFPKTHERKGEAGLKIAECYFALDKRKEGCLFLKEIMNMKENGGIVSTATLQLMEKYWLHHKCAGH